jgi:hypothetical protein
MSSVKATSFYYVPSHMVRVSAWFAKPFWKFRSVAFLLDVLLLDFKTFDLIFMLFRHDNFIRNVRF